MFFPLILASGTVFNQWRVLIHDSAGTACFLDKGVVWVLQSWEKGSPTPGLKSLCAVEIRTRREGPGTAGEPGSLAVTERLLFGHAATPARCGLCC